MATKIANNRRKKTTEKENEFEFIRGVVAMIAQKCCRNEERVLVCVWEREVEERRGEIAWKYVGTASPS